MKTDSSPATKKAVIDSSQIARLGRTLRLQVALDEAAKAARAERIKRLREESPFTQPVLAEKVGVTLRAYQRWEEGGGIEWEHLEKLAEIHDVEVQWIHRGQEHGPTPDVLGALSDATVDELREKLDQVLDQQAELLAAFDGLRDDLERQRKPPEPGEQTPGAK